MQYRNAKYINENGWIDCEINHPELGWIPYTLDPDDIDMTVDNSALLSTMGVNNDVAAYVPPTQEELDILAEQEVRMQRNEKLKYEVDPIAGNALRWADLTDEQRQSWTDYRQALLDIPQQAGFPHNIDWPIKPE